MSESVVICPQCAKEFSGGVKFCGTCGVRTEAPVLASQSEEVLAFSEDSVNKLKEFLAGAIANGENPLDDFESICEDFGDLGLPKAFTLSVIQEFSSEQALSAAKIQLYYDAISAKKGVALGATGLELRVENISSSGIASVGVSIIHPEDQSKIDLEKIVSLGRGKTREIVKNLRLGMVGQHFINGEVVISLLNGSVEVYRFASPIRLLTENSNVSRHTHMSQTITTNGGGIVSESGMGGMTQSPQNSSKSWELVRLVAVNLNNHSTTTQSNSDGNSTTAPQDSTPVVELVNELTPTAPVPPAEVLTEGLVLREAESDGRIELGEPFSLPIDYENEAEELLLSYQRKLIEGYLPQQLLYCAQSQITPRVSIYKAVDINFSLLKTLSKVEVAPGEYLKMSDIFALAVKATPSDGIELEAFDGRATAVTVHGLFVYKSTNGEISLEAAYDWTDMKDASWEVSRQIFGTGSEIISLGRSSEDALPCLTFDLRKSESKVDVAKLGEMIQSTYRNILSIEQALGKYYPDDVVEESIAVSDEGQIQEEVEEDLVEDVDETIFLEDDDLTIAARSFFAMYAFVSQYCNESYDRPIHVYIEEEEGGDIALDLAEEIQALFPSSKLIAICEEDHISCHDGDGKLISWNGMACAVTREGIFHVNSSGNGHYELAGKNSFLSWQKLFGDLKADLIIRDDVPDMWIGTQDTIFIKGVYVDYSSNINEWIYFNEFVRKEFVERLMLFKDAI